MLNIKLAIQTNMQSVPRTKRSIEQIYPSELQSNIGSELCSRTRSAYRNVPHYRATLAQIN